MRSTRTRLPGLSLVEHELEVPVDHDGAHTGTLTVFARELTADARDAARFPLLVSVEAETAAAQRAIENLRAEASRQAIRAQAADRPTRSEPPATAEDPPSEAAR